MGGRSPGKTCMKQLTVLDVEKTDNVPFMDKGGGCGASMRAAAIGLAFNMDQVDSLIEVAVESGRMTHHNPWGYLAGVMAALFTRLGLEKVDPNSWMAIFFELKPKIIEYLEKSNREVRLNLGKSFDLFFAKCAEYAEVRKLSLSSAECVPATFPE